MSLIPESNKKLKILWWNCNKRFYLYSNNIKKNYSGSYFDGRYDLIFVSETNLGYDALPNFKDYSLYADIEKKTCTYGGIAWYVKDSLAKHVFRIRYSDSHISFQLDITPGYEYFGVYIQPEGARYFNPSMFSRLASDIISSRENGMIPLIGGDFNSRIGDPSSFVNSSSWSYNINIDTITNKHGRTFFRDFCSTCDIMPINCVKFRNLDIDNDFTVIGGNGRSQIDFALTDAQGKREIQCFKILNEDWHLSDHRPIVLEIEVSAYIDIFQGCYHEHRI